jgi:hypothetical protein
MTTVRIVLAVNLTPIPAKSHSSYLTLEDPEGWYDIDVRWDGCMHLTRYYNAPREFQLVGEGKLDTDYLHICNVDEIIALLQQAKKKAIEHFGKDWPR